MPRNSERSVVRGITLLEIIVSLVLLSLVMAGMANLFVSSKRWTGHSGSPLAGSGLSGQFLSGDKFNVSQDNWDTDAANCLNGSSCPDVTIPVGAVIYTAHYAVTKPFGIESLRKVVLNISWNENTP